MKTKNFIPIGIFLLVFCSCSQKEDFLAPQETPREITVSLPNLDRQVTYGTLPGTNLENGAETDKVCLYLFHSNGALCRMVETSRGSSDINLSLTGLTLPGKLVVLTCPSSNNLPELTANESSLTELEAGKTDTADERLAPSFYMGNAAEEDQTTIAITQSTERLTVKLKRRVARVDVTTAQEPETLPFTMEKVTVKNSLSNAFLLDTDVTGDQAFGEDIVHQWNEMPDVTGNEQKPTKTLYIYPDLRTEDGTTIQVTTKNKDNSAENTWKIPAGVVFKANHAYRVLVTYYNDGIKLIVKETPWGDATLGATTEPTEITGEQ